MTIYVLQKRPEKVLLKTYITIGIVLIGVYYIMKYACNLSKLSNIELFDTGTILDTTLKNPNNFQGSWNWCNKCSCMFFGGGGTNINCPKGGSHSNTGSTTYYMPLNANSYVYNLVIQTPTWKWCNRCSGFFNTADGSSNTCFDKGPHNSTGSWNYCAYYNQNPNLTVGPGQQIGWRWCKNCGVMFFSYAPSFCPKTSGSHDGSGSFLYVMFSGGIATPVPAPAATITPTPAPVPTPIVAPTPAPTPVVTPTPAPVVTPTPTPVVTPTPTPVVISVPTPVVNPTSAPPPVVPPVAATTNSSSPAPVGVASATPVGVSSTTPVPSTDVLIPATKLPTTSTTPPIIVSNTAAMSIPTPVGVASPTTASTSSTSTTATSTIPAAAPTASSSMSTEVIIGLSIGSVIICIIFIAVFVGLMNKSKER